MRHPSMRWLAVLSLGVSWATRVCADPSAVVALEVYPPELVLTGPRDTCHLVVVGRTASGERIDLTRQAHVHIAGSAVVRVQAAVLYPHREGTGRIVVEAAGQRIERTVSVRGMDAEPPVDFVKEVVPVLTKLGCNQGPCHGAQYGKGGFKLSLLGFDPEFDHAQIVKSAEARRVTLADPERSILLQKPTLNMEHGGGQRLEVGSREYELLRRWLEEGAPGPQKDAPTVVRLEVYPPGRVMQVGQEQQLAVYAVWSDGSRYDVTPTAQYDSLNEALARVDKKGLVTAQGRGESHIMVRYQGQVAVYPVTVPYRVVAHYPQLPRHNFIDEHLENKWRKLGLEPSPLCSDEVFLRRVYLDLIGTLPTPEEVRAFLADADPDKRARVIDALLERPEFVDFWALKWGDLLRINRDYLEAKGMWSFHNWIRAALRDRRPLDEFVREIVTARGSTYTEGPANYYRIGNNAADWAETTSQVFLGVRIGCARCHHHPFEKWSQDDYYGMAAFFARLGTKGSQEFGLFGRETIVYLRPVGEQTHPRKGKVVRPRPLDGHEVDDPVDRRRELAAWMTAPDNPFFSRNLVNRFWGYLMGRGLFEPLDDQRATNPPTNAELLDALARDWVAHRYDLRHLLRTIANARAYQLSSQATPGNAMDRENVYFARYTVKRLTAEQLADAVDFATGTQEKYPGLPLGTRAIQLPDPNVGSYFLDVFGRPMRQIVCECERTTSPNIAQALHLLNGDVVNGKISRADGRVAQLVRSGRPVQEMVEELYLVTVSRPPRPEEKQAALAWIQRAPSLRIGLEDLLWSLLNSREFLFNH